jgi:hypothetical protein
MTFSMNPLNLRFAMGWLALGALVVSLNLRVLAATNLVVAGDDLQTKINAAAPGDTLVVQSGIYGGVGNLTITKPISLVRSGVERAVILLPVAVSAPGVVTFSKMDFGMDLGFGGTNCTVRIYDAVGKNIASTNGALVIRRSTFDGMVLTGTKLEALRLTNTAEVRLIGNGSGKPKVAAVLVQSRCESYLKLEQAVSATLGYCFLTAVIATDSEINAVGTKVFNINNSHRICSGISFGLNAVAMSNTRSRWWNCQIFWSAVQGMADCSDTVAGISSKSGGALEVSNCDIIVYGSGWPSRFAGWSYGMFVETGKAEIRDSFFHLEAHGGPNHMLLLANNPSVKFINCRGVAFDWYDGYMPAPDTTPWQGDSYKEGHRTNSVPTPVIAGSNIGSRHGFTPSPASPINCSWVYNAKNTITIPTTGPNAYKDFTNELAADSPLINAGSDDPVMRNRDGTRNTIGATGGPMYNPALATTDQPMAFWLGLFPQRIVKGLVNTVDLDAAAAAGH